KSALLVSQFSIQKNNMKKLHLILLATLFLCSITAPLTAQKKRVSKTAAPANIYGKVENGVYTNDVFRFSLTLPANWKPMKPEFIQVLARMNKDTFKGDSVRYNKLLEENFKVERVLMSVTKEAFGMPGNAFIGISSQKIPANSAPLEVNAEVTR